jgi:succinoglycan biosynthesis transport protein ExoP
LASALIRDQDRTDIRVFGITALQPGGGSSMLTQRLTQTFRSMGISALAIDANAFSRDPYFDQSLQYTIGDPLPDQLPQLQSLRLKANGRHLQTVDKLGETLQKIAETFRFVLVDVPPLLVSGDAELTLRATPAILAIVEAEAQSRGEVSRAARLLQGIDPSSIGVVVNQVRPLDGGGYIRDLMTEFTEGRKAAKTNLLTELWLTAKIIGKASISLCTDFAKLLRRKESIQNETH